MMKRLALYSLLGVVLMVSGSSSVQAQERETLFQLSTIDALMSGIFDGAMTLGELKRHGDIGIGTFHTFDGEMVVVDGIVYQVRSDGTVHTPDATATTPFAAVTFFDADQEKDLEPGVDLSGLIKEIDGFLPTQNLFYAIRIEGTFKKLKARSVPKQAKPYPTVAQVVKTQPIFDFENIEGVIVGFRCPPFVKGINVPGYHLHFLTKDKKAGGHVLELVVQQARVKVDHTPGFHMILPKDPDFYRLDWVSDPSSTAETFQQKQ
jgi:acetolactate decarboxylase